VVCENCIIDEHSSVANSIVAPGTYVGQGLELDEVIVDRNRLLNVKFDSASLVSDTFLLSGLTERRKGRHLLRLTSIVLAFALLIITSLPAVLLLLHLLIGRKGKLTRAPAVSIPAGSNEREWREYQYPRFQLNAGSTNWPLAADAVDFWMSLLSVVNGDLFLVGLKPRSQREINALPDDWRSIYLKSKAGVITEATVRFGESPNDDELYSAEACYSATESLAHDLKLTWLYIWKAVASLAQRNSTSLTRPGADSA
jgi:lipopolysaccharide/colanic/teichoic acid biosynthesis glycosyltransferase